MEKIRLYRERDVLGKINREENKKKIKKSIFFRIILICFIFVFVLLASVLVKGCIMLSDYIEKMHLEEEFEKDFVKKRNIALDKYLKNYLKNKYGEDFETEEHNKVLYGWVGKRKSISDEFSCKAYLKRDRKIIFDVRGKIKNPLKENEEYIAEIDGYMNVYWDKDLKVFFDTHLKKIINGQFSTYSKLFIESNELLNKLGYEKSTFENVLKKYPEKIYISSWIIVFKSKDEQNKEMEIFEEILEMTNFVKENKFKELGIWIVYCDNSLINKSIDQLTSTEDYLFKFQIDTKIYDNKIEKVEDIKKYIIRGRQ